MCKKYILPFQLMVVGLALASCEKTLDFKQDYGHEISVFALAMPDESFSLSVSSSFTINNNPSFTFSSGTEYYQEIDSLYQSTVVIKDANAEIIVNGTDHYTLHYSDESPYRYTCAYVPKPGDDIEVHVSAPGYNDVSAFTHVYEPRKIEVVSKEVVYSDNGYDGTTLVDGPYAQFGEDSVMRITLRIHDVKGSHDYYRLRVRALAYYPAISGTELLPRYNVTDAFTSSDVIFIDNMLSKPWGDWEAGITNVFDDHLFDGSDYTCTVESRKRYGDDPKVVIELQTISPDMYYFLKSYQQIRITTDESFTTPVGLYSNVNGGWGIVGSLTYDRHIIYY